jgi:hypothetical protein
VYPNECLFNVQIAEEYLPKTAVGMVITETMMNIQRHDGSPLFFAKDSSKPA